MVFTNAGLIISFRNQINMYVRLCCAHEICSTFFWGFIQGHDIEVIPLIIMLTSMGWIYTVQYVYYSKGNWKL